MAKASQVSKQPKSPQKLTTVPGKLPYKPKTAGQVEYLKAMRRADVIFCLGVAGSGKSVLAAQQGYHALTQERYERLIISRPIVGVGRTSGYLPGSIDQKLTPFLDHLYDELIKCAGEAKTLAQMKENRQLKVVPFEYMRGNTFDNAWVIVDEAQNCTTDELFLLLTRFGENSKMIIIGDPYQSDLPIREQGALELFASEMGSEDGCATVYLNESDIVRHPIVKRVIQKMQPIIMERKHATVHHNGVSGHVESNGRYRGNGSSGY